MTFPIYRSLAVAMALATVCACGRHDAHRPKLPAALVGSLGATGALNAGGEAPLWSAQVRPGQLHIETDAGVSLSAPISAFSGKGKIAQWGGKTAAGAGLTLTAEVKACRDEATGMTYPLTAKVSVGDRILAGCAARPGNGLGPRT
jgi:uncharacterized membrane protein